LAGGYVGGRREQVWAVQGDPHKVMVVAHKDMDPCGGRKCLKEVVEFLHGSELPVASRVNGEVGRHYRRKVGQASLVSNETGDDDYNLYR